MPFALSGITHDGSGDPLGECDVYLLKYSSDTDDFAQHDATVSDATTGAYTLIAPDDDAAYCVIAFQGTSPVVAGVTRRDLVPSEDVGDVADFYVASYGNDGNDGSLENPWATVLHGWSQISAGETLGVLDTLTPTSFSTASEGMILTGNGTEGSPKRLLGIDGRQIIDMVNFEGEEWGGTGIRVVSNWAVFEKIHVKNVQWAGGYIDGVCWRGTNGKFINSEVSHVSGRGFAPGEGGNCVNLLISKSDFHHCYDPETNYQNADGLQIFGSSSATGIVVEYCRFWNCSDDGVDLFWIDAPVTIRHCWSWGHGYREDQTTTGGDGTGFKMGGGNASFAAAHTLERCLVGSVRGIGVDNNANTEVVTFYRNTIINALHRTYGAYDDGVATELIANVKYSGGINSIGGNQVVQSYNSWNTPPGIGSESAGWFRSVTETGLDAPRGADGSLPVITFGKIANGSPLIGAGPSGEDLGCFDYEAY